MTTLRAHFDGRFLVPDEPVDLPRDRALEVQVREVQEVRTHEGAQAAANGTRNGLPLFSVPPTVRPISMEDVRRGEDEL